MTTRVYAPTGEPFDIPRRDLADKLILEDGWTQTVPVSAPVKEKKVSPKPKKRYRSKSTAQKNQAKIAFNDLADAGDAEDGKDK